MKCKILSPNSAGYQEFCYPVVESFFYRTQKHLLLHTHPKHTNISTAITPISDMIYISITHKQQLCPSQTLHTHPKHINTSTTMTPISNITCISKTHQHINNKYAHLGQYIHIQSTSTHQQQLHPSRTIPDGPSVHGGSCRRPPPATPRIIMRDVPPSHRPGVQNVNQPSAPSAAASPPPAR